MAGFGYKRCACCGMVFAYSANAFHSKEEAPDTCSMCSKRGGLCLHNLNDRAPDVRFHSSRPHESDEFADDPEHCPVCIEARENAEWGRRVMNLNPVDTWPVAFNAGSVPERDV